MTRSRGDTLFVCSMLSTPAGVTTMAFLDSDDASFDADSFFDEEEEVGALATPQYMKAKIKLDITDKNEDETLTVSTRHTQAMAEPEAVAVFATPDPSVAAHASAHNNLANNINQRSILRAQLDSLEMLAPVLLDVLKNSLRFRVSYVQLVAKGDPAKILLSGFDLASEPVPVGDLPAPINFEISLGDPGVLKPRWKPVPGARSYILECAEHTSPMVWTQVKVTTTSRTEVTGLVSGKTYAFRVRAVGSNGEGPWSDEAVKMAP